MYGDTNLTDKHKWDNDPKQMWSTYTNWWATKELQENGKLAAAKNANLRDQNLANSLGAMQTDDGMCTGRGAGKKKVGIGTRVWKRLATCKREVLVSVSPAPPHQRLSCLHAKSLLDYLCAIPYALSLCVCVWVSAAGTRSCQGQCEWMWDQ